MQKLIAAPLIPNWNVFPKTAAEAWKEQVDASAAAAAKRLPALREQLGVKVEPRRSNGVKASRDAGGHAAREPQPAARARSRRLLRQFPGESGTVEAIYMAGFGASK